MAVVTATFERTCRTQDAANILGVRSRTVLRMAEDGRLTARMARRGRGLMFCLAQVEALRDVRAAKPETRKQRTNRTYHRALCALRDKHRTEFDELYAKARAEEGLL
jgi:excisionase family DNA binding protein